MNLWNLLAIPVFLGMLWLALRFIRTPKKK